MARGRRTGAQALTATMFVLAVERWGEPGETIAVSESSQRLRQYAADNSGEVLNWGPHGDRAPIGKTDREYTIEEVPQI